MTTTDPQGRPEMQVEEHRDEEGKPYAFTISTTHRGFGVSAYYDLTLPWDGPTKVEVAAHDFDAAEDTDGVTYDLLRGVPLGDLRRKAKQVRTKLTTERQADAPPVILARVETEHDYAVLSHEYVRLVEHGDKSPVTRMARSWGVSRNTMSGRIRRAREMGFLTGEPGKPADRLTGKATEILENANGNGVPEVQGRREE